MNKQFARKSIRCCVAFLVLSVLGACGAPALPKPPSALQTDVVVIVPTGVPIPSLQGQIIPPLLEDTNNDGTFEPVLAQSWITETVDDNTFQAIFVLPGNWASQNNSTFGIEDIAQGLSRLDIRSLQDPNTVGSSSGAGVVGNPCIYPTSTQVPGISPRLEVMPSSVASNNSITLTLTLADCTLPGKACEDLIGAIASIPLYNPNTLTYESTMSTGEFVFSITGSDEWVRYNPETGNLAECLECKKGTPESIRICPTKTRKP